MNSSPPQEPGGAPGLDDVMESCSGTASRGVRRMKHRVHAILGRVVPWRMKHRVRATLLRLASQRMRNFAAFDQVLASGSNFLTGILLVRALGLFEYGRFALAWMFVEFLASLQTAAIIQPMLNIGSKQAETDRDRYYDAVFAQQVIACMVFGPVAWASATLAGWLLSDPEFDRLALPLCAAVMAYQLQSFFRRYFFALTLPTPVLATDAMH